LYAIRFQPIGRKVICERPMTLLEVAQEAGIEILALCGGMGACGRCRVKVQGEGLPAPSELEQELLSEQEIAAGYRLACRTLVQQDQVVYIPEMSRPRAQKLQIGGREQAVAPAPRVRKYAMELPPPSLQDARSDLARLADCLQAQHGATLENVDPELLPALGPALREADWHITATLWGTELIQIEPSDRTGAMHGVAIDLGSTKIALYLVDLNTGRTLAAQGIMNPQIAYGEDVMTRITYAADHADGTERLQKGVIEAINAAIAALCGQCGGAPEQVLEITLVGNTAMHHLLLGLPTAQLARSPCVPVLSRPLALKARRIGLHAAAGAYVYLPPVVAGFVGSDHVAMVLSSRLDQRPGTHLAIDVGTNTEISLKRGPDIWAVSCASGPAFEGAAICWGMKAAPGAIERVWIDPRSRKVAFATIQDAAPVGICGSGILDCVAGMLGAGMLDARGRMQNGAGPIRTGAEGLPELVLAETESGQDITVTQRDVERIQLAKGAIRSGIEVLMDAAAIGPQQIDSVILAGAFGSFIDPLSALQIGMLPAIDPQRITQVGNAAGVGAKEMLISTERRRNAQALADRIQYLELTVYPRYSRFFAHALRF
jgi:uncharacterized 2Fe-2S/4Fe-4S cluster protein (DUF4445 family)